MQKRNKPLKTISSKQELDEIGNCLIHLHCLFGIKLLVRYRHKYSSISILEHNLNYILQISYFPSDGGIYLQPYFDTTLFPRNHKIQAFSYKLFLDLLYEYSNLNNP